jgi:hypothetical protein
VAQSSRQRKKARRAAGTIKPPGRSEAKNQAVRESLEPLAPGERPGAVTVGAVLVTGLAIFVLVRYLGGVSFQGKRVEFAQFAPLLLILVMMSYGLWRARYWAVLGLQALLGLLIVYYGVTATLFGDLQGVAVALAVVIPSGYLFYKLVKAMARIQMPERS